MAAGRAGTEEAITVAIRLQWEVELVTTRLLASIPTIDLAPVFKTSITVVRRDGSDLDAGALQEP